MATTVNHFDALGYVKKSKELGVSEQVAEYQARQIEKSIEIAVSTVRAEIENKELATKKDIGEVRKEIEIVRKEIEIVRKEIAQASNKTIVWIGGLFMASGLIQHFFK
ncbi:MAG: hypothetical protein LW807_06360 [Proteobacteria bacterium]|jgi:hypothetical protein|nr:hypothetical protein [Pseudomonadota bacterium]